MNSSMTVGSAQHDRWTHEAYFDVEVEWIVDSVLVDLLVDSKGRADPSSAAVLRDTSEQSRAVLQQTLCWKTAKENTRGADIQCAWDRTWQVLTCTSTK